MTAKWLIGLIAGATLLGARAGATEKVDFDQGVDVSGMASTPQAQSSEKGTFKTYSVSAQAQKHAKGFVQHKNGPARDYKGVGDFQMSQAIPNTLDLRQQLTPIQDQGQCGDCWAFSLTATNRDGHAIAGNDPGRLSQEWLTDTDPNYATPAPTYGCNGGDFDAANDLIKGQPSWNSCPYTAGANGTVSNPCAANLPRAAHSKIKAWHMLGDPNNGPSVMDIEAQITRSGQPISIALAAGAGDWENYSGGVYNGCTDGPLDHMINIVGWDNEGAAFDKNGNLPPGKGVWILRNSWGTSWGENGYMRTKMTDSTGLRCNEVAQQAAYFDF